MRKFSPKDASILISLIIFISSLFFTAFKVMEPKEIRDYHSLELLLVGSISFLGGGILEFYMVCKHLVYSVTNFRLFL
jgi:hypothetical protein